MSTDLHVYFAESEGIRCHSILTNPDDPASEPMLTLFLGPHLTVTMPPSMAERLRWELNSQFDRAIEAQVQRTVNKNKLQEATP